MPALAFSLASWPSAGPETGVLDFLIPALAEDQMEPKASPPAPLDLAAPDDLADENDEDANAPEVGFAAWGAGAWTEVK